MRMWKDVATLVKTKSLNGKFVARPAADFPFMLEEGMHVAFVPPQTDCPRDARVESVRDIDGMAYEVEFDAVTSGEQARDLVGCHCLVERADLDETAFETQPAGWVGWRVVEGDGSHVGEIAALVENPGQVLIEVDRGAGRMAYIPVVDAIVREVDEDSRSVAVDLPAGLLDL